MPKTPSAVLTYLQDNNDIFVNFLLEIEINFGGSLEYFRFCLDSTPLVSDSGAKTWTPWPIDFENLVQRLSQIDPVLELQIYDPDDGEIGAIKRLLQQEKILSRAILRLWMVVKAPYSGVTQAVTGPSTITNTLTFASDSFLRFGDMITLAGFSDGSSYDFEVQGFSGNNILIDNNEPITWESGIVVQKPMYKDSTTWARYYDGGLDASVIGENSVQLSLKTNNDKLTQVAPKVRYSLHCPYITADANCTMYSSNMIKEANATIISYSAKTMVIAMTGASLWINTGSSSTIWSDGLLPIAGKPASESYWAGGGIMVLTGNAKGIIRGVRACTWDNSTKRFTLTLDRNYNGSVNSGVVKLLPSCSRNATDCSNRFANGDNFGGQSSLIRSVGGMNVPRRLNT